MVLDLTRREGKGYCNPSAACFIVGVRFQSSGLNGRRVHRGESQVEMKQNLRLVD